jgi:hypothetical protein
MIAAIFFIIDYSFFFATAVLAERQSQSINTICNGNDNSCFTTICSDGYLCRTFPSDRSAFVQPDEEASVMQPDEEASVMQPVEVIEEYIKATLEDCDDGLDNDIDGKVDALDEECNSTTSSSEIPVQGQSTSHEMKEREDHAFERPSKEGSDDEGSDSALDV